MSFTLAILKPDAVANPIVLKYIGEAIFKNGLKITKGCRLRLSQEQASQLYSVHASKFFYDRLIRHICSGPVIVMQLSLDSENFEEETIGFFSKLFKIKTKKNSENPNVIVIKRWREILGPSKLFANLFKIEGDFKDSDFKNIRQFFSVSDTRNVGHGSDSSDECQREYYIFKNLLKPIKDPYVELFQLDKLENKESNFFT